MEEKIKFAVIGIQHAHIYGMCSELIKAGAQLVMAYDKQKSAREEFSKKYPDVKIARNEEEILSDKSIQLVTSAAITSERAELGMRVMLAGKDYFVDKGPFTTFNQLEKVKKVVLQTGKKYMVCYSERLQNDCAEMAGEMIKRGDIGRVVQVMSMGPHKLNSKVRPDWFWRKKQFGGIISDICSHQFEQFLYFSGAEHARVLSARVENFAHKETPEFEDFGEASLIADNGASGYVKVDWFSPDGLDSWGDCRAFIVGTDGYIELRKNIDILGRPGGNHMFITTNSQKTRYIDASGYGHPFFKRFIDDIRNGTCLAMSQQHVLESARLTLEAQKMADRNCAKYSKLFTE